MRRILIMILALQFFATASAAEGKAACSRRVEAPKDMPKCADLMQRLETPKSDFIVALDYCTESGDLVVHIQNKDDLFGSSHHHCGVPEGIWEEFKVNKDSPGDPYNDYVKGQFCCPA